MFALERLQQFNIIIPAVPATATNNSSNTTTSDDDNSIHTYEEPNRLPRSSFTILNLFAAVGSVLCFWLYLLTSFYGNIKQ